MITMKPHYMTSSEDAMSCKIQPVILMNLESGQRDVMMVMIKNLCSLSLVMCLAPGYFLYIHLFV
jgi:hypothetical protein